MEQLTLWPKGMRGEGTGTHKKVSREKSPYSLFKRQSQPWLGNLQGLSQNTDSPGLQLRFLSCSDSHWLHPVGCRGHRSCVGGGWELWGVSKTFSGEPWSQNHFHNNTKMLLAFFTFILNSEAWCFPKALWPERFQQIECRSRCATLVVFVNSDSKETSKDGKQCFLFRSILFILTCSGFITVMSKYFNTSQL